MTLLLDTHALLWFCEGNPSLSATAREALENETNERWVSHATIWEVAIKVSLGKLDLQIRYEDLFPDLVIENGWRVLAPDFKHYRELLSLPAHHRDPFDRLLVAQAKSERMTLVTRDPHFSAYGVPVLW